jgi:hypothetical protein
MEGGIKLFQLRYYVLVVLVAVGVVVYRHPRLMYRVQLVVVQDM